MKKINYLFSSMLIVSFFMLSASKCEKVDPETDNQIAAKALTANTWEATKAVWSESGVDLMQAEDPQYTSFTINFTADTDNADVNGGSFTVTDGGYAFPGNSSDQWEFASDKVSDVANFTIVRTSDAVEMDVNVSETAATLTVPVAESSTTAKMYGTTGEITFSLVPQN